MPPVDYLRLEQAIARAHRTLWGAHNLADTMQLEGVAGDLWQIALELERVQESMLRNPSRKSKLPNTRA